MKFPFFIEVPNFRKDVLDEEKPKVINRLTPAEQDEYLTQQIQNRMNVWSCTVAARAFNLAVIVAAFVIITGGSQLWEIIQHAAKALLGI